MKKFFSEFKAFAMRGNVVDMAVGVIVGGAFGKIITSVVNDLLMPLISLIIGRINLAQLKIVLRPAEGDVPELAFAYGNFLQTTLDFVIVALCIFLLIKAINKLHRKKEEEPAPAPAPTPTETLLTEIRDLLAAQGKED